MKLNFQYIKKKKIKGVTLLELIISIGLTSLIILSVVNLMASSTNLVDELNQRNERKMDLDFAVDYILQEIDASDLIIPSTPHWLSGDSLKIELVKIDGDKIKQRYNHIVYRLDGDKIVRYTSKSSKIVTNKQKSAYLGRNTLIKDVNSFYTELDKENKILHLKIETEDETIMKTHYIRGIYYED